MASFSTAATCSGGDASSILDQDEEAMWSQIFQIEQADRVTRTLPTAEEVIKTAEECVAMMKEYFGGSKHLDFEMSNEILTRLEGRQVDSTSMLSGLRQCIACSIFLVYDRQRRWESRFLKLFWKHSNGLSDASLLLLLSKLAEHYSPSHEVEKLEEFMLTAEERAMFLIDCSTLDRATRVAKDFIEFSRRPTQGQEPKYWPRRNYLYLSSSESVKPFKVVFPFSTRFQTAKECLDRLDLLKSVTLDLNPDESDTLASVLSSFKSPELQALHALKKEMELHEEVALQLEQLRGEHLHAYKEWIRGQLEGLDKFFRICEEEERNVVQEALYKKVKCLASIKKAGINRQASKDLLKSIVQKAGSALKEVEGKLKKVKSSKEMNNKECSLCYVEFSKKQTRACLDPCGHASACINCATKAWANKPYCPWCKVRIEKPIPIPLQLFF